MHATLTLDRLEHHGTNFASQLLKDCTQFIDIVGRAGHKATRKRAENILQPILHGGGNGLERTAVEAAAHAHDSVAAVTGTLGVQARKLHRALVGLGAGVGKEGLPHLLVRSRGTKSSCCGLIAGGNGIGKHARTIYVVVSKLGQQRRDLSTLLCVGIALAPAFKMRFWNCGGEGQILIGGLTAALIMVYQGNNLPLPLLFAAMALGSIAAGALWGFIPAWFKSRWNTNETLFTLMMNYVATSIVACMTNIMRGQASSLGTLNKATKAGWFPVIMGQRYTINIIVVIVLTFVMYAYLRFSKQGYEISVVGESENTARYAGINVRRVTVRTMLISGAICGLCGFLIVAGKDQTISTASANGRGFTAIIVAWLAKFNTFYMALISFLLVFLERGASEIASAYSLNEYAADIITGIILFFILGSEFFINYRVIPRGAHKEGK